MGGRGGCGEVYRISAECGILLLKYILYEEEWHRSDREHEERMMGRIAVMCQPQMPPPKAHRVL